MSNNNGISATALPPGADASYVERMVARAEQGGATFDTPAQADFAPPIAPEFRSKFGSPKAAAAASASDLLIYKEGGTTMEIEVSQAVAMGLIRPAAGGGFEAIPTNERQLAEQAQRQEEQQEQQKAADEREAARLTGEEPDEALQGAIDDINSVVPAPVINSAVEEFVANGGLNSKTFGALAQSVGLHPVQARLMTQRLADGYVRQADLAVSTHGISANEADAAYAWMAEHHPGDHKNAMRALVFASDTKPLKALAAKYAAFKRGGDI